MRHDDDPEHTHTISYADLDRPRRERFEAACAAMTGLLVNGQYSCADAAEDAVLHADALIAQLAAPQTATEEGATP